MSEHFRMKTTPRSVIADTRGAIMVLGIVMGSLLIGALWYIASIGDAAIWRERMLDAADAAAMESAVWNARGMNVITVVNIIMAFIMSFLVIWRMVQLFLIGVGALLAAVGVVACAAWFTGVGTGLCLMSIQVGSRIPPILARMEQFEVRTKFPDKVIRMCVKLHQVQQIVATATPIVGSAQPVISTQARFGGTPVGGALSSSLLPVRLDREVVAMLQAADKKTKGRVGLNGALHPRIGGGGGQNKAAKSGVLPSLPVQAADYDVLCQKAAGVLWWSFDAVIDKMFNCPKDSGVSWLACAIGNNSAGIGTLFETIVGKKPELFCSSKLGGGLTKEGEEMIAKAATQKCEGLRDQPKDKLPPEEAQFFKSMLRCKDGTASPSCECTRTKGQRGGCCSWHRGIDHGGVDDAALCMDAFDIDDCENATKQLKDTRKLAGVLTMEDVKVAEVWDIAANGNIMMQSWGAAFSSPPRLAEDDRLLQVAGSTAPGGPAVPEPDYSKMIAAQGEMYFDCEADWTSCSANAMWQVKWRGRLRRLHSLDELAAREAGYAAGNGVSFLWDKTLGAVASKLHFNLVPSFAPCVDVGSQCVEVRDIPKKTKSHLVQIGSQSGYNAASWVLRSEAGQSKTIH
jgi:hypothetical protein